MWRDNKRFKMSPVKLEGPTLGHKHRNYNEIVKESFTKQTTEAIQEIDFSEHDVNNLIKVDTASMNRNVDYILGVLKGNDMLYVSRALTQSLWLITDNAYAHIINPEYLHSHLIPHMMTKAANKLLLHVRLHLRDETRVENFFNYYEPLDLKHALKWLPHCSAAFMEVKIKKKSHGVKPGLMKRLCEKSHHVLETYVKTNKHWYDIHNMFKATKFLLNTHLDFYLTLIETSDYHAFPHFNEKYTKLLMKACPERIHKHFWKYASHIHIPTFLKSLNENKVMEFLIKHANTDKPEMRNWINFDRVQHFLMKMPQEERVNFIRDVFVNECFKQGDTGFDSDSSSEGKGDNNSNTETARKIRLYKLISNRGYCSTNKFLHWYKCLPFDVVLNEFKENIKNTTSDSDRIAMFQKLTNIVDHNMRHLETLLQYYNDNHLNDSKNAKAEFIRNLLERPTNILSYDAKCYSLLMSILKTINLNIEEPGDIDFDTVDYFFITTIIIHHVVNKKEVPEKVEKRFDFCTFKEYQKKMNSQEQKLLFDYLYSYLFKKIDQKSFNDRDSFGDNADLLQSMLRLLNDWKKNLAEYPYVFKKINELIKTKKDNSLTVNLSWIYDVNKSWRKYMFEESIILCESDRVCVNALKHDPSLLTRYEDVITSMRCNDRVPLKQLLVMLRIYWADSIAIEWSQSYRERLSQPLGHKSLIRGLTFLLPQRELSDIINKYKPEGASINWENDDEVLISLRRHIAKNMHFGRPQPAPEDILQYAKGDYLQFALPSLNAILYNLSTVQSNELIPKLLDSPVSLQKHGIRFAFTKLQSEDLKKIFSQHWKTIKNLSIRAVTFKLTFELLCKEKNPAKIENVWGLLSVFIDALTFEEDKAIYSLLGKVEKVPDIVTPAYIMKSYKFLKSLLPNTDLDKNKYEQTLNHLLYHMDNFIDSMEPEFIAEIIQEYYTAVYTKEKADGFVHNNLMPLLASFLCSSESIEVQTQRYEAVLLPLLKHSVAVWATKDKNDIVKTNLKSLLKILRKKIRSAVKNNEIVPVAMFADIQKELERSLDQNVAYLTLREWKLTAAFAKVVNDNKDKVERVDDRCDDDNECWNAIFKESSPQFGKMCLQFLRDDIKLFFPSIDEYFTKALSVVLNDLIDKETSKVDVLKHMLSEDLVQSYLVTIRVLPSYYYNSSKDNPLLEFYKTILSHSSLEVKMHFYHKNKEFRHNDSLLA